MSEQDELDRLERQLDAAFANARPRREFEDELWARLERRRRWRWLTPARVQGLTAALVVVALFGLTIGTISLFRPHVGGGASTASAPSRDSSLATTPGGRAEQAAPLAPPALPFGRLPAPPDAGIAEVADSGRLSPLPAGVRTTIAEASLPQPASSLSVFHYDAASGPPSGAIIEPSALPANIAGSPYPTRPAGTALQDASQRAAGAAGPAGGAEVTLTQARLVYVAVVSGSDGYLEPAYLFTGTYRNGAAAPLPAQVLVPAVAAVALR